ncbi:hypothetical protein AALO_G00034010 [Alosa alosa]|uniref:Uncharacterized protein n=1 Tax=Alosa alosa TaxID=278164 RepID=A0AAV6HCK4_9TELE|nr:hypothetical protein AALO_G00034010 [Alosa alosa]
MRWQASSMRQVRGRLHMQTEKKPPVFAVKREELRHSYEGAREGQQPGRGRSREDMGAVMGPCCYGCRMLPR